MSQPEVEEYFTENLNLFDELPYQIAIESTEFIEVLSVNSLDSSSSVEFISPAYSDRWKILDEIYLRVRVQILKDDDTKYTDTDTIQPQMCNCFSTSIFKSCTVLVNGSQVTNIPDFFQVQCFIENVMNYNKSSADNKLCAGGIYSKGSDKLKNREKNSVITEYYARMPLLMCSQWLLPGCSLTIRFTMASQDWYLIEGKNTALPDGRTKSKVKITELSLFIRHGRTSENFSLATETKLSQGLNALYEYKGSQLITYSIPKSTINLPLQTLYTGRRPLFAAFGIQETARLNGKADQDPLVFNINSLERAQFVIDSVCVPTQPYVILNSKDEKIYARAFNDLHQALSISHDNNSTLIDYENYVDGLFFIGCDLTTYNFALTNLKEPHPICNIGLNLKFSGTGTTDSLTIVLYLLHHRSFEISAARNVSVNY